MTQPVALADLPPDDYALTFATVTPVRLRHDGLTPDRQRCFVVALRETGVVAAAAGAIGVSPQAAYKLRRRPDAAEFAAAWDRALDEGRDRAFDVAVAQAQHGCWVPRYYRGRYVGTLHRYDNRLPLAALRAMDRAATRG
jgi:hypothetical protein